jgi:hypothetical protein
MELVDHRTSGLMVCHEEYGEWLLRGLALVELKSEELIADVEKAD